MEKLRVLLADESPVDCDVVRALLAERGDVGEVVESRDGVDAYVIARAHLPHLAIVSAHLPRIDGIVLVRTFRRSLTFRNMPSVLVLDGFASDRLREALEARPSAILVRPFTGETLASRIEQALRAPNPATYGATLKADEHAPS